MSDASMYESTSLEVLFEKMLSIRVEEVVVILVGCVIEGRSGERTRYRGNWKLEDGPELSIDQY